jgi:myo-inositol 2-dehydrogenase / D-chiro-inositol 1-dehydrogenase
MSTGELRIGVIGAGIMGADHARTLHRSVSGASVALLADVDTDRARAAVDALGAGTSAEVSSDPRALIEDPRVDAVVIASPDATHPELTLAAVRAGKAVLCEKPVAPSLGEAVGLRDAIRTTSEDAASLVSIGFMRRFDPGHTELRAAIAGGDLGRPLLVHCISRGVSSAPGATSESSVSNSAIHDLDSVPWLLGSPVVQASWQAPLGSREAVGLQDPQLILMRTADGVLSTCEVFLNARYGYDVRCEVVGESGALSLVEPVRTIRDAGRARSVSYPADWRPRFADAYRLELQAWVDGVRFGSPSPLADLDDGVRASAVAEAVVRSMHNGGGFEDVKLP